MRLVTRSDFDGLVCAVLLEEQGVIDEYFFVHPKDVQDGKVDVNQNDVLANVPYAKGCGFWFDHHSSEAERVEIQKLDFKGDSRPAQSAAQVIWDYYGGEKQFDKRLIPLLEAVNKADSGDLNREEILYPEDWIILAYIMDARTGLGRFKDYRIGNHQLMEDMVQYCRSKTAKEILAINDIQERVMRYFDQQELFVDMMLDCSEVKENVVVSNLLGEEVIYSGNRFVIYALFPEQNADVRVMWGKEKQNVVVACGHSVLNRTCQSDIGKIMLAHGGGGHTKVGTCQIPIETWEKEVEEIITDLVKNG